MEYCDSGFVAAGAASKDITGLVRHRGFLALEVSRLTASALSGGPLASGMSGDGFQAESAMSWHRQPPEFFDEMV